MRTVLSRRASALGPQPVNDLNTVLHLTEHRMTRPATLRLLHHLFPVILWFFEEDLTVLVSDVHIVSDRNLRLLPNLFGYGYLVSSCDLYHQASNHNPIRRIGYINLPDPYLSETAMIQSQLDTFFLDTLRDPLLPFALDLPVTNESWPARIQDSSLPRRLKSKGPRSRMLLTR